MSKNYLISCIVLLSVLLAGGWPQAVTAADFKDIEALMAYAAKNIEPQEGLAGGAMWVLGKEEIPQGGSRNIYLRIHDGGNRPYITVMRNEIIKSGYNTIKVVSTVITDGGSAIGGSDELGPADGYPDLTCVNIFVEDNDGAIKDIRWGVTEKLRPGTEKYRAALRIFDETVKEIKKIFISP